jgi:hypothetical protein
MLVILLQYFDYESAGPCKYIERIKIRAEVFDLLIVVREEISPATFFIRCFGVPAGVYEDELLHDEGEGD